MLKPTPMLHIDVLLGDNYLLPIAEYFGTKEILHLTKNNKFEALAQKYNIDDQKVLNAYKLLSDRAEKLLGFFNIKKADINREAKNIKKDNVSNKDNIVQRASATIEKRLQDLEYEAEDIDSALSFLSDENKRLNELKAQIIPLKSLDTDLDLLEQCNHMTKLLATIPSNILPRLQKSLSDYNAVIIPIKTLKDSIVIMAFATDGNEKILRDALQSVYFREIILPPHLKGTPENILEQIEAILDENNEGIEILQQEKKELLEKQIHELREIYTVIEYNKRTFEMVTYFVKTKEAYLIGGWIPANKLEMVNKDVEKLTAGTGLVTSFTPEAGDSKVPVRLDNIPFIRSFQLLTKTYGIPLYEERDPTLIVAISSVLMFGAMFGDVGHGLSIFFASLAGMWFASKQNKTDLKKFPVILSFFGLSATLFGILFGSFFGKEDIIPALWLSPMHTPLVLFLYSCSFGALLIIIGLLINISNLIDRKKYIELCCDKYGLPGILFYGAFLRLLWSLVSRTFTGISIFDIIFLGAPLIIVGFKHSIIIKYSHNSSKAPPVAQQIIEGLSEVAETIITFFSNTMSFIRIGAFAICHAILCQVVYIFAEDLAKGGVAGVLIIIGGNIFIICFEGFIVSIQTIRLEYYEFFSKFFKAGGTSYKPFALEPKD